MMKKWKNISGEPQLLIGVGVVQSDEIVETDVEVNNPNFVLVEDEE